jgi:autotransporter-associated beta strand protein
VTFYSDAGSTVGGTGVIDLMNNATATGTNTINLNGGTLTANQIKATSATGTRVINFNGGTLKSGSSSLAATFLASGVATTANVRNGGAIIDTNGNDVTIGQALVHSTIGGDNAIDGGLIKNGAGKLTLAGTNTFTGNAIVNAGTLSLATNVSLDDTIVLSLATGTTLDLGFASGSETIFALVLNGSNVTPGTYTDAQLNALGTGVSFTSLGGTLTVTSAVPEPGVVVLLVAGLAVVMLIRRRNQMT